MMERATALALWTKHKPKLLLDTGVSKILRNLPKDMTADAVNTKDLLNIAKQIDAKRADKKIKAEKKALACLVTIKDQIESDAKFFDDRRSDAAKFVADIHALASKYIKDVKAGPVNLKLVSAYNSSNIDQPRKKINAMTSFGRDASVLPVKMQTELGGLLDRLDKCSSLLIAIVEDAIGKKGKYDTKKDFPKARDLFEKTANGLPSIAKDIKNLP